MNWILKIQEIRAKLHENGYYNLEKDLINAQLVLGTAGEMFMSIISKLKEIKETDTKAYNLIEPEVEELLKFGRSLNYLEDNQ